ncbi:3-oxo-5-alpha-steroid 4-dehydrogenase C-terminal [Arabidopsis suecica]|uniref:3-oxo-5-alpha-steroid 4-dehydrogenase C-terminal n=1 Tax=Arabidopsis suecica TaxID=45249 RepID=A0A8T2FPB7_ARASU|nr:3-oxo-5-alpha-steroid 4-dehydrogenase C-terminal [Arabidopsis suecica]
MWKIYFKDFNNENLEVPLQDHSSTNEEDEFMIDISEYLSEEAMEWPLFLDKRTLFVFSLASAPGGVLLLSYNVGFDDDGYGCVIRYEVKKSANLPIWLLFGFVAANLTYAAGETHRWYLGKFENYPANRHAIFPYVY